MKKSFILLFLLGHALLGLGQNSCHVVLPLGPGQERYALNEDLSSYSQFLASLESEVFIQTLKHVNEGKGVCLPLKDVVVGLKTSSTAEEVANFKSHLSQVTSNADKISVLRSVIRQTACPEETKEWLSCKKGQKGLNIEVDYDMLTKKQFAINVNWNAPKGEKSEIKIKRIIVLPNDGTTKLQGKLDSTISSSTTIIPFKRDKNCFYNVIITPSVGNDTSIAIPPVKEYIGNEDNCVYLLKCTDLVNTNRVATDQYKLSYRLDNHIMEENARFYGKSMQCEYSITLKNGRNSHFILLGKYDISDSAVVLAPWTDHTRNPGKNTYNYTNGFNTILKSSVYYLNIALLDVDPPSGIFIEKGSYIRCRKPENPNLISCE